MEPEGLPSSRKGTINHGAVPEAGVISDIVFVVGIRVEEETTTWNQHAPDLLDCLACNFVRRVDKRRALDNKVEGTVREADFGKRFDSQFRCEAGSG
jgi:hypothetical protein